MASHRGASAFVMPDQSTSVGDRLASVDLKVGLAWDGRDTHDVDLLCFKYSMGGDSLGCVFHGYTNDVQNNIVHDTNKGAVRQKSRDAPDVETLRFRLEDMQSDVHFIFVVAAVYIVPNQHGSFFFEK